MKLNEEIDSIILRYLENYISKEDKEILLKWLQYSEENSLHFEKIVHAWEISRMFDPCMNRELHLEKIHNIHKKRIFSYYNRITGLVAILVICVLTITLITQTNKIKFETVLSENIKKQITLPDNTTVWLNVNSSLKYPLKFNKNKREVTLIGEAFFNVAENRESPFIVSTPNIKIKVLGTRFYVKESLLSDEIEAVLESGSISLKIDDSSKEYILVENDKLIYNKTTKEINLEKVNAAKYTNWIKNRLIFENTSFENVFKQLEKWYDLEIVLLKENMKETPVSFIIDDEPIDEVLNTLKLIEPFEYEHSKNKIIIK